MKQVKRKLMLNKKTVADLSSREMDDLRGGTLSTGPSCYSLVPEYCGPSYDIGCNLSRNVDCGIEKPTMVTDPLYCAL